MRYALITNGIVANVIEADAEFATEHDLVLLTDGAGIGWSYSNGTFSPPAPTPEQVPEFVTRAQAKIALARAGLYEQVVAVIAAAPLEAQIWWAEADTFRRDNQWVAAIGGQLVLPLSKEQTDTLFVNASKVEA